MDEFVRFACPECNTRLKMPVQYVGETCHCVCGHLMKVPGPALAAVVTKTLGVKRDRYYMQVFQLVLGVIGYFLLVVSASMLYLPFVGALAFPISVVSILMCGVSLFLFPQDHANNKWLTYLLIIIGLIGLFMVIAGASFEYTSYLVARSRNRYFPSPWLPVFAVLGFDIVTSGIIVLGVRRRTQLESKQVFLLWLSAFLSVPITSSC